MVFRNSLQLNEWLFNKILNKAKNKLQFFLQNNNENLKKNISEFTGISIEYIFQVSGSQNKEYITERSI